MLKPVITPDFVAIMDTATETPLMRWDLDEYTMMDRDTIINIATAVQLCHADPAQLRSIVKMREGITSDMQQLVY